MDDGNGEEDQGLRIREEERIHEEEEADELYRDVNINKGRGLQVSHDVEDSHVALTPIHLDDQQESSSVSSFVTSMLNPISDAGVESIFMTASSSVAPLPTPIPKMTPSIITTITTASHPPIPPTLIPIATDLSEMELKKILIEKMEGNKSIQRLDEQRNLYKALVDAYEADKTILESYGDTAILKRRRKDDDDQEGPSAGSDRGSKRRREEELVQTTCQMDEPLHPPRKPPTPDHDWNKTLPAVQGSAQTWISELVNPEGQQYPHNLMQPLPLIPDNRGRRVIPFAHFINNDLEYLWGDLVPHTMWIQEPINYDKHALWGVSHWGRKRQQFYGFAVNQEFALDVYSKRRIIAVTDLKIVEWHNYKHLDWILVCRDDDKIYKFKEGDFKRLRL
nr:hypothetical protein [Tanacetum cinerariifolium]